MKKKFISVLLAGVLTAASLGVFAACGGGGGLRAKTMRRNARRRKHDAREREGPARRETGGGEHLRGRREGVGRAEKRAGGSVNN